MSTLDLSERVRPSGETLAWGMLVLTTEFLLVASYVVGLNVTVRDWTLFVVPFVWINVGLWAVHRTTPAAAATRKRLVAAAVAGGYFLLLAYFGGLVGPGTGGPLTSFTVELWDLPPGWSPAVLYNGPVLTLAILPYKVVGYLALAYLVYATALDASNALVGGVVGLFSCVSCSFPIIAGVVTGIVGSGGALAAVATGSTYLLSTVVFVVTVGLLYWRPAVGGFLSRRVRA
ncbi:MULTISPECIES: DUF7546 family protein [Salinibaculum]|uniref:DUF7546 family protein n=1 Tax=Salinibaculum TaxID=2732368 RepID=UPI0030CC853C